MADWVAYAYSAAVAAGGLMGYVKKGSIMSGIMGVAFGRYVNEFSKGLLKDFVFY